MKHYEILVDERWSNEYRRGRISGIIEAFSSDYQEGDIWVIAENGIDWTMEFYATEEEYRSIIEILNRYHRKEFVGIREIG